jgi:acyl-coenzyme A synthetase/AMP-(fatty) acid ligase
MKKQTGNIVSKFIENAKRFPEKPAIIYHDKKNGHRIATYGSLLRDVQTQAAMLAAKGIGKGDRVVVFIPMSYELYQTVLALFYIGAVAVFIDAWGTLERLNHACRIAAPSGFIGSPKAHILMVLSHLRRVRVKMMVPSFSDHIPKKKMKSPAVSLIEHTGTSDDDEALVTFTTGSTGRPKAARRTHGFLRNQHEVLTRSLGIAPDDVDLTTLPIFLLNNLAVGCTSVIPRFDPAKPGEIQPHLIADQIAQFNITTSAGSPAFYESLAEFCIPNNRRMPLKKLFVGGAPVYPENSRLFRNAFPDTDIRAVYGSTEAEPISELLIDEVIASELNEGIPAGNRIRDIALRIIRPIDGPIVLGKKGWREFTVKDGEIGEIVITGPHVLKEYLNSPEDFNLNKIVDGKKIWHRTGDAGKIGRDGKLFLFGRVKNRIQTNRGVIYTLPIEIRLKSIGGITAAAIISTEKGNMAFLECKQNASKAMEEYARREAEKILRDYGAFITHIITSLPRDPRHNSKIDYEKLRLLFQ